LETSFQRHPHDSHAGCNLHLGDVCSHLSRAKVHGLQELTM
jgi:hypothetical protein